MIKDNLRRARKQKNIQINSIVEKLNISKSTYYSWEEGEALPATKYIEPLCSILRVDANFLFGMHINERAYAKLISNFSLLNINEKELLFCIMDKCADDLPYLINLTGMYCAQSHDLQRDEANMCLFNYEYCLRNHCNDVYFSSHVEKEIVKEKIHKL